MPAFSSRLPSRLAALLSLALLASFVSSALAGDFELASFQLFKKKQDCDCQPCPQITPAPEVVPPAAPEKKEPEKKAEEKAPAMETPPLIEAPEMGPALGAAGYSLASSNVGYIDDAIPETQIRLRYDAAFGMNTPDKAEYFYPAWKELSFHPHGVQNSNKVFFDANARGPDDFVSNLSYQEVSVYGEKAFSRRFSAFVNVPIEFVNFRQVENDDTAIFGHEQAGFPEPHGEFDADEPNGEKDGGLSDISFGFKYAIIADPRRYLTFQLTATAPTGTPQNGIGNGLYSIEPALLGFQQLSDKLTIEDMFKVWVPLDGGPLAGNILNYGIGVGYEVYRRGDFRLVPVVEFVGWTILNGYESVIAPIDNSHTALTAIPVVPDNHGVQNVGGQTIVNAKVGLRTYFGHNDMYIGFGQALTDQRWYNEIARVEYRYRF